MTLTVSMFAFSVPLIDHMHFMEIGPLDVWNLCVWQEGGCPQAPVDPGWRLHQCGRREWTPGLKERGWGPVDSALCVWRRGREESAPLRNVHMLIYSVLLRICRT